MYVRMYVMYVEPTPFSASGAPLFSVGDKVESNNRGTGRWYPGSITAVRTDGSYDLLYDNGELELESAVPRDRLRIQSEPNPPKSS